ncbi:MAG: hypothetical protein GF398_01075 [Chitinivibrionales bacterium]|nr:hypothetical protein [Chitinivibrionales bacterium]
MKTTAIKLIIINAAALSFLLPGGVNAGKEERAARKIFKQHKRAVITVRIVTRQRMIVEGREMDKGEQRMEATAVIINPEGLAVMSLFESNPWDGFNQSYGGEDDPEFNWESEISDLIMHLESGERIDATLILRDKDLDMLFIKPRKPVKQKLSHIDCATGAALTHLDKVVILGRLGKAAGRVASVSLHTIQSVIPKPRTFYVPDQTVIMNGLGRPAFTLKGDIAGIVLMRVVNTANGEIKEIPVILPAEDVAEVAEQAREK